VDASAGGAPRQRFGRGFGGVQHHGVCVVLVLWFVCISFSFSLQTTQKVLLFVSDDVSKQKEPQDFCTSCCELIQRMMGFVCCTNQYTQ
jgi:hypothetical protein